MMVDVDAYGNLPADGPLGGVLGHALLTLSETTVARAGDYNRYYEGDHFLPVAMNSPWIFAGRRWHGDPGFTVESGFPEADSRSQRRWFLAAYWIDAGRLLDAKTWLMAAAARATAEGRAFSERVPVLTTFADYVGSRRKPDFPSISLALMDPTQAVTVEVVKDERGVGPGWLLDRAEAAVRSVNSISAVAVFRNSVSGSTTSYTLLWFLDARPEEHTPSAAELARMSDGGYTVQILATLAPRRMGTGLTS